MAAARFGINEDDKTIGFVRDERAGVSRVGGGADRHDALDKQAPENVVRERVCSVRCAIDYDMQFVFEEAGKG